MSVTETHKIRAILTKDGAIPIPLDQFNRDINNTSENANAAAESAKAAADSAQAASTTEATVDQKVSDAKASVQAQFDALGLSVVDGKLCVTYQKE